MGGSAISHSARNHMTTIAEELDAPACMGMLLVMRMDAP
jgi:hypothetical protein